MPDALTQGQLTAISAVERGCSVLSLIGCVFTILTFCFSSAFHKPINRLVFYASFGNMMTNVGTLMSRAYINDVNSAGCQMQAFLIQMFMPADAYWTLAMAVNVYLTFYRKYDAAGLRRMEIPYIFLCYGVPCIPALVFIFVKDHGGNRAYGNATLWCWISTDWDIWRIAAFYAPVWISIIVTFFIYIRAGRTIYEKRKQLRNFHSSDPDPLSVNGDVGFTVRTTEITVTSEAAGNVPGFSIQPNRRGSISAQADDSRGPQGAYSVHISSNSVDSAQEVNLPIQGLPPPVNTVSARASRPPKPANQVRRRNHELNNAAWSYTKCAILFFTALLITWIPSSANRVFSVVHKDRTSAALEFMSAFVLPLQGFWNAVIYAVTSWSACKGLVNDLRPARRGETTELSGISRRGGHVKNNSRRFNQMKPAVPVKVSKKLFDSESTTELATSRATSADGRSSM